MANREELYVGADSENADDYNILIKLGYDPGRYYVSSKRDGPSGGGGDDCCYVVIKAKSEGGYIEEEDEECTDI